VTEGRRLVGPCVVEQHERKQARPRCGCVEQITVPMIVGARDDERILGVQNDAAVEALRLQPRRKFEKLTHPRVRPRNRTAVAGRTARKTMSRGRRETWKHVRADGT